MLCCMPCLCAVACSKVFTALTKRVRHSKASKPSRKRERKETDGGLIQEPRRLPKPRTVNQAGSPLCALNPWPWCIFANMTLQKCHSENESHWALVGWSKTTEGLNGFTAWALGWALGRLAMSLQGAAWTMLHSFALFVISASSSSNPLFQGSHQKLEPQYVPLPIWYDNLPPSL
jgi:hypothetical protein